MFGAEWVRFLIPNQLSPDERGSHPVGRLGAPGSSASPLHATPRLRSRALASRTLTARGLKPEIQGLPAWSQVVGGVAPRSPLGGGCDQVIKLGSLGVTPLFPVSMISHSVTKSSKSSVTAQGRHVPLASGDVTRPSHSDPPAFPPSTRGSRVISPPRQGLGRSSPGIACPHALLDDLDESPDDLHVFLRHRPPSISRTGPTEASDRDSCGSALWYAGTRDGIPLRHGST
jgi:hypothetical protein